MQGQDERKIKKAMQKSEKNILAKVRRSKEKRIFRGFNLFFWLFSSFLFPQTAHANRRSETGSGAEKFKNPKTRNKNEFLGFSFFFFIFLHF